VALVAAASTVVVDSAAAFTVVDWAEASVALAVEDLAEPRD
jgi:hypothetical protein